MAHAKLLLCTATMLAAMCSAQTTPPATTPAASTPRADPAITQIRKAVTFIKLTCNNRYDVRGTGFFLNYPDSRLGKELAFVYLVTNRHVALCWNPSGQPMSVENISIRLNRSEAVGGVFAQEVF